MENQKTLAPENPKKPLKSFKILLIAGAVLLVLLVLGGGIALFVFSSFPFFSYSSY